MSADKDRNGGFGGFLRGLFGRRRRPTRDGREEQPEETRTAESGAALPVEETLTDGRDSAPGSDETLTGGLDLAQRSDETLTGGLDLAPPSEETRTGGVVARLDDVLGTLTQAAGRGDPRTAGKLEWKVGDVIDDRYEVLAEIGRGGMGTVLKVRHLEWRIDIAVKMPLPHLVAHDLVRQRFLREAQTWVDLGLHPNIVQCWYVRELGGLPRIFMDFVSGGSLKSWMSEGRVTPGDWTRIIDLAVQACDGLGYAHEREVVHRDVKPANFLMTPEGGLRVTDFGIVKLAEFPTVRTDEGLVEVSLGDEAPAGLTLGGQQPGTPEYAAPEQWGEGDVDARADVYALGVVLYELCCGRRPFDDGVIREPPHVLIGRHLSAPPPAIRELNPETPADLEALILRCLAKEPGDRPESMAVLRETLVGVYERIEGAPFPRPAPEPAELRADSLNNRAVSWWDLGRRDAAIEAWNSALEADPRHVAATRNLGTAEWTLGRITSGSALSRLRGLEPTQRENSEYWRAFGVSCMCCGQFGLAKESFARAVELGPKDVTAASLRDAVVERIDAGEGTDNFASYHAHGGSANAVAVDPAGRFALTVGNDGALRRWDLRILGQLRNPQRREELSREDPIPGLTDIAGQAKEYLHAVAISPDSRRALTGGGGTLFAEGNRLVQLWDLETGECLQKMAGHTKEVKSVCFTPDGRRGLSGGFDHTIRVWDLETGECERIIKVHDNLVCDVTMLPDGERVLSASEDRTLRLWELETGECLRVYEGHELVVYCVALSPDGRLAVSGSYDCTLRFWDVESGACLRTLGPYTQEVLTVSFSATGRHVIAGYRGGLVLIVEVDTGRSVTALGGVETDVNGVAGSADEHYCLVVRKDGILRVYNTTFQGRIPDMLVSRARAFETLQEEERRGRELEQHADVLLGQGEDAAAIEVLRELRAIPGFERAPRALSLWHRVAGRVVRVRPAAVWTSGVLEGHDDWVLALAVDRSGERCLSASKDKTLRLWDLSKGRCVKVLEGHAGPVHSVGLDPTGRRAVSGSEDGTIRLWDLERSECLGIFRHGTKDLLSLALSADGRYVIAGFGSSRHSGGLAVWDLKQGRVVREGLGPVGNLRALAVGACPGVALSGSKEGLVQLWDLSDGRCLRLLEGHEGDVNDVALSADGRFGLSAGKDKSARLWDLASGECLRVLEGHDHSIHSVAFSPCGRFGMTGSVSRRTSKIIRLWDLATGECPIEVSEGKTDMFACVFTSDARYALLGSYHKTVLVLELDWEIALPGEHRTLHESYDISGTTPEWVAREDPTDVRSEPYDAPAWNARANDLWEANRCERAHDAWRESLRLDPLYVPARYNLAVSNWRAGELTPEQVLEELRGAWPESWESHLAVARVHAEAGDPRASRAALERAEALTPDEAARAELRQFGEALGEGHGRLARWDDSAWSSRLGIEISADGRYAFFGGEDGACRLWDLNAGEKIHELAGPHAALSADGSIALAGDREGTLRVVHLAAGATVRELKAHEDRVTALAISPDGTRALSAGAGDTSVRLWDLATGSCMMEFKGHEGDVGGLWLGMDRFLAASACADGQARIWELATGRCIQSLEPHRKPLRFVALTADGRFAVTGDEYNFHSWDVESARRIATRERHREERMVLALIPGGSLAVSATGSRVQVWDVASGIALRELRGHTAQVYGVAVSVDGALIVTASKDKLLRLWETRSGRCLGILRNEDVLDRLALTPDGSRAVTLDTARRLSVWRIDRDTPRPALMTGRRQPDEDTEAARREFNVALEDAHDALAGEDSRRAVATLHRARSIRGYQRHPEMLDLWQRATRGLARGRFVGAWEERRIVAPSSVIGVRLLADVQRVIAVRSVSDGPPVSVWDLRTGHCLRETGMRKTPTLAPSSDGRLGVLNDGSARCWLYDLVKCSVVSSYSTTTFGSFKAATMSADSQIVFTADGDGGVKVWDFGETECRQVLDDEKILDLDVTPDGSRLVARTAAGWAKVWDVAAGSLLSKAEPSTQDAKVRIAADGRTIISGGRDGVLRVFEADTGNLRHELEGHGSAIAHLSLTADGAVAATVSSDFVSDDRTLRIWDLVAGDCLAVLGGYADRLNAVDISSDGARVVSGGDDCKLRVWRLDWE